MTGTRLRMFRSVVRISRFAILAALAVLTSVNCGAPESDTHSSRDPVARDSAGVRIVESTSPVWSEQDQWMVDSVPAIDIASAELDASLVLAQVNGIVPLPDERFAVVNGSDRQLLVFSATGQLLHRIARRGTGPGDLARPSDALPCGGDSIVVNDVVRIPMFEASGAHVREWPLSASTGDGAVRLSGVAADCSGFLLYARPERLPPSGEAGTAPVTLFWTSAPDQPRDTLDTFDARRIVRRTLGRGGDQGVSIPWSGETRWASSGGQTYVALDSRPEIRVYDRNGELQSIFRWHAPLRRIEAADRERYNTRRDAVMGMAPIMAELAPSLDQFPELPDSKPPHLGVLVDDSARVWLRDYPDWVAGRPDLFDRDVPLYNVDDEPNPGEMWQLFGRDGRWQGAIRMPPRLAVRAIAGNRVYGVWRDDDGAERVRVHAIDCKC